MKKLSKIGWACVAGIVLLLVFCYIYFGLMFTIITAAGIGIIIGLAHLVEKVSKNKKQKKALSIVLIVLLTLGVLCLVTFVGFLIYIVATAPKFNTNKLNAKEMTILYDKNEKEITRLGSEKREKITYDQLPEVLVDAIIATEDARFFQHNGVDAPRFIKASLGQLAGNSSAGGASTLSMQVIKNSFTSTDATGIKGIIRKFTDIYLAVFKLEKNYTKEQIIEFYVNNHFLGGNVYGVKEAALAYFGKDVSDLNLSEAAIIAGMFQSPNYYRPNVNPKNATARRDTVLKLMVKHGYITEEERKKAAAIPVESLTIEDAKTEDTHTYQAYIDTVVEELEDEYGINAYVTPLKVYTNMDPEKQDAINDIMNGVTYNWADEFVQSGVSVLDSQTGKILAIGAGRHRQGVNTFNYATQMNRQPGSGAKPLFDYGPGMEYQNWSTYGYNTGDDTYKQFVDAPYTYSDGTVLHNWDNSFMGTMTLRRALALSRNIPAVKAFQLNDNKKIIEFVEGLGIKPEIASNGKIHEAHALGAFNGVTPLQMSAAYAAFSNGGYYNKPFSVTKIVYRDTGETVKHKSKKKKAMSDSTAYMMASVLQDVTFTGGNGKSIPGVAAKTGTTNLDEATKNARGLSDDAIGDSWVNGFTTKTVISMWYGYDEATREHYARNLPATKQRDSLFRTLADKVFEKDKGTFTQPDSVEKVRMGGGYEYFKKGHEPKSASQESSDKLDTPTGLKVTANGSKVTITWNGVSPKNQKSEYGAFGYNVYFNNTLIAFTESTSYTYTNANPYGTYKVEATYKSYSGAKSGQATFTLKEDDNVNLTYTCNDSIGVSQPLAGLCIIYNNSANITSEVSWQTALNISGSSSAPNTAGSYTLEGLFNYKGSTYKITKPITVTATE